MGAVIYIFGDCLQDSTAVSKPRLPYKRRCLYLRYDDKAALSRRKKKDAKLLRKRLQDSEGIHGRNTHIILAMIILAMIIMTNSSMNSKENHNYVNPPAGSQDANSAAPVDLAAIPTSNAAAQVRRNWADITEEVNPGAEEGFTLVQGRKRRRGSANSPTAAAPSSNAGGSRTIRRPQPSAGSVPRAQEIRVTRAHIAEARARQASSSEEHCVYIEHSPELEPFHYLRALDRMLGGTAGVIQITKVNGHQLLGLTNRGLAERLISEGLEMKAGPYVYVDGRRDVFITLHEGITIERIPTRLDINIKGEAWPAYLSSGIRCSRCHGQGHRRAICPLLAGLANNTRMAPPTTPAGVPPPTTPAPPQRSAAQPPAPTPSNPAMEVCSAPPVARAALHSSAPRPSPPAAPAFPMEETPPAPPPVTPAPSLQTPGSREPAAPTPDVEMSIVETFASSTSSAKNATRVDLDAFIEGHPSVSFAKTDALGLGREEVLDLLSSRTKAQRKGPLLSPPQCDALAGLIGQILDLRPGAASNLYKVLGQVRAELRTTPAVPPTPPLPAPRPAETAPPAPQGEESAPAEVAYPPPLPVKMTDEARERWLLDLFKELNYRTFLIPLLGWTRPEQIIRAALHSGEERNDILGAHPNQRSILANFLGSVIERARGGDQSALDQLSDFRIPFFMNTRCIELKTKMAGVASCLEFPAVDDITASMVSLLKGEEWKRVRAKLTPVFSSGKMRKVRTASFRSVSACVQMALLINECAETTCQNFAEISDTKEPYNVRKIFGAFTMDVIATTAFGTKLDSHHDPENPFVKHAQKVFNQEITIFKALFSAPNMEYKRCSSCIPGSFTGFLNREALAFFADVTEKLIEERRQHPEIKRYDFLQIMLGTMDDGSEDGDTTGNQTTSPSTGMWNGHSIHPPCEELDRE
ncbi:CYP3A4 [Cordylochernes scorpioides]|uniref:CYP3A4 n=1 Tax=Cordylochernes scorpioides TaxID=51811 RepID=A0ABY6LS40_9ARAC|nr:CYP3A4 [Cordylochernes scorpioides]